jgi:hypothetical protein
MMTTSTDDSRDVRGPVGIPPASERRKPGRPRSSTRSLVPPAFVRLTANVPPAIFKVLEEIAHERHSTLTEALKVAITTEKWIRDQERKGCKILVEQPGGKVHEVVFR